MALGFFKVLDADGVAREVLCNIIDEESNRYAQVLQMAFGAETDATLVSPTDPMPMGFYSGGVALEINPPGELVPAAAPSIFTGVTVQYDSLHTTPITFPLAASANGRTGRILGARLINKHDTWAGQVALHLFRKLPTGTTAGVALAVSDPDKLECFGVLTFDFSAFPPQGGGRTATANRAVLPLDYKCDVGTDDIYGILQILDAGGPTFAADALYPILSYVAD